MQQSGASSDQQHRVPACGIDTLLHDTPDPTVHWIQVGTILWPQVLGK